MDQRIIDQLEAIVGKPDVVTNKEQMQNYLFDESPASVRPTPASDLVLVRPADAQQVSTILTLANDHRIALFPRGGGTGLVGGAVPSIDGIILSMERMNKIEIDTGNMMAVAEAGVTLERLAKAADAVGLSFPPHPGDESAQVGGMVATNAGGSRAVRHGVMRNQVRAIEVVLPTGEILNLGRKVHKNNVGYDLMQLIIGSEGTLAVITKATLQLYPKYGATATLILPFSSRRDALSSVSKILRNANTPLAIEFVERGLMEKTAKRLGARWPVTVGEFYLIVIVAESDRERTLAESLKIAEICKQFTTYEPHLAESKIDQDNILKIRSNIYSVLKTETADILDTTVPVAELEKTIEQIDNIAHEHATTLPIFGHAGDGNLHIHIMRESGGDQTYVENIRNEIYEVATKAGGVITGEHGIGKIRTDKVQLVLSKKEVEIMQRIKKMLDPNGILNPGTKLPN